jgi:hypothetical protein
MKLSPFDFLNSINQGMKGPDLMASARFSGDSVDPESPEKQYGAFVINRSLSYFPETVLIANELNRLRASNLMQFDFLRNMVRPGKRFAKWVKGDRSGDLELIMKHYCLSRPKALDALNLLTDEAIEQIRKMYETGGLTKKGKTT